MDCFNNSSKPSRDSVMLIKLIIYWKSIPPAEFPKCGGRLSGRVQIQRGGIIHIDITKEESLRLTASKPPRKRLLCMPFHIPGKAYSLALLSFGFLNTDPDV